MSIIILCFILNFYHSVIWVTGKMTEKTLTVLLTFIGNLNINLAKTVIYILQLTQFNMLFVGQI
jgi:hypothetical protein